HRRGEARIEARVAEGQRAAIARLPLDARREPGFCRVLRRELEQSRARIETNDPAAFADAARDSAGHRAAAATDIEDALAGRDGEELEIRVAGRHFVGRLGAQLEPRGELAGLLAAHPRSVAPVAEASVLARGHGRIIVGSRIAGEHAPW